MLLPGVFLKTCRGLYTGKEPCFVSGPHPLGQATRIGSRLIQNKPFVFRRTGSA